MVTKIRVDTHCDKYKIYPDLAFLLDALEVGAALADDEASNLRQTGRTIATFLSVFQALRV